MIFAGLWVMISSFVREKQLRNNQDQHQSLAPSKKGSLLLLLIIPSKIPDHACPTSLRPEIGNSNLVEEGQNDLFVWIGQQPSAQEASSLDTTNSNL